MEETQVSRVVNADPEEGTKQSFLDYSMSVVISRALPDVHDDLKLMHRRILYTMLENGLMPEKGYRKCADTVGTVLARYHPYGDASVYDALVRLAQNFSMRCMLVDGHGNLGSVDGNPPAAYHYTEACLGKPAVRILTDIEEDTIDSRPNYDDCLKEPVVLPIRFPNILINGSADIIVGMATNIPPYNMCEVVDGLYALIDNSDATMEEFIEHIKGSDFPTGGIIMDRGGIHAAYDTGRGRVIMRARAEIKEEENGRSKIVISGLPCQVSKVQLIEIIADLVRDRRIEGISSIEDHSNRSDMHVVIDVERDTSPQIVLNRLYTYTQMQTTFGVIMLVIVDGGPKTLTLKEILQEYVRFQESVIMRHTQFELCRAQERTHILRGLQIAIDNVDKVISIIRSSESIPMAKRRLTERFEPDDIQTQVIVQMPLGHLTGLERQKLEDELAAPMVKIADLEDVLANVPRQLAITKEEALAVKAEFGGERRTEAATISGEVDIKDLIPQEECVLTITNFDYVKHQKVDTYHIQRHGDRGVSGMTHREEDAATEMFIINSHGYVLFSSNLGRVYRLKRYEVPEGSRTNKGINIANLLPLSSGESITSMVRVPEFDEESYLVTVTKSGIIKRTVLSAYNTARRDGVITIDLDKGDLLNWAHRTDGSRGMLIATEKGMSIRSRGTDVRAMGRTARGVKAITLKEGDCVTGLSTVREGGLVLAVSETDYGHLSPITDYRTQSHGDKGLLSYHVEEYGDVTPIKVIDPDDDVIITSSDGVITHIRAASIRVCAHPSKGVRAMRVNGVENHVITLAGAPHDDEEETGDSLIEDNGSTESAEDLMEGEALNEAIPEDEGVPEEG